MTPTTRSAGTGKNSRNGVRTKTVVTDIGPVVNGQFVVFAGGHVKVLAFGHSVGVRGSGFGLRFGV